MYAFLVIVFLGLGTLAVMKVFNRYLFMPELRTLLVVGLGIGGAWLMNINFFAPLAVLGARGGWIGITMTGLVVAGVAYFWGAILDFFSGLARKHTDQAATLERTEHLRRVA
jgi:hypothetical protein